MSKAYLAVFLIAVLATSFFYFFITHGPIIITPPDGDGDGVTPIPIHPVTPQLIASGAAWCWFQNPRAIWVGNKVFGGYKTGTGDIFAFSYDLNSGTLVQTQIHHVMPDNTLDDHLNPGIVRLGDGRLIYFYNEGCRDQITRWRRTTQADDISSFEPERSFVAADVVQYGSPFYLEGKIFLFYACGMPLDGDIAMAISTDNGNSFSTQQIMLSPPDAFPYFVCTCDGNRIDFCITGSHPPDSSPGISHSIYYCYYQNGAFYRANGQRIKGLTELPLTLQELDLVYDVMPSKCVGWAWDVASQNGVPYLAFQTIYVGDLGYFNYDPSAEQRYVWTAYLNGRWTVQNSVNAGGSVDEDYHCYVGGVSFDRNHPSSTIFIVRGVGGGVWQLEAWQANSSSSTPPGGTMPGWDSVVLAGGTKTMRPVVPVGSTSHLAVFYMAGTYHGYYSWNTNIYLQQFY